MATWNSPTHTNAYHAAIAGNDAAKLANASRMSQITGRDLTEWMDAPTEDNGRRFLCMSCNWNGQPANCIRDGGAYLCPQCESDDLVI